MKMNPIFGVPAGLFLCLLFAASAIADEFPAPKVEYSADMVMDMSQGPDGKPVVMNGKIFASKQAERREMHSSAHKSIIISRRDENVLWILLPDQKMYMESQNDEKDTDPEHMLKEGKMKLTKRGTEKVNGVSANKYEIESTHDEGGRFKGHFFVTQDNVPVRMEGDTESMGQRQHFKIDYTNIKVGKQDPSLFKVPAGYKKMVMPVMPGMGSMPGGRSPHGMPPGDMTEEEAQKAADEIKKQMEEMMKQFQKNQGNGN